MANMLTYLSTYGNQTFKAQPLTVVDAAILAQLAYCDFAGVTTGRLGDLTPADCQRMMAHTWQEQANQQLLEQLAASTRFADVRWFYPVDRRDPDRQQEFSAVTWQLDRDTYYLAFRGTRATFVDWKEDFNMTFLEVIPSQHAALAYLQGIAAKYPGRYYLGGHSKGGTLATYAFTHAEALQDSINMVYNLDGPGLKKPLPPSAKVLKLVPQTSLIGMMLDNSHDFGVVHSTASGLRQHDLFTWEVHDHNFVYLEAVDKTSQYFQALLTQWAQSVSDDTKQQALDAIYALVTATQQESFAELAAHPTQSAKTILSGLQHSDPQDRQAWRAVLDGLARAAFRSRHR
ncbi:Mbeg1-like protein [Lacticaseibacillus sp. GG6-2]